jgi:hypothetical protein
LTEDRDTKRHTAESLVTETLLVALLSRFAAQDPVFRSTIAEAFDEAARLLTEHSEEASKSARAADFIQSLRILEGLRLAALGAH